MNFIAGSAAMTALKVPPLPIPPLPLAFGKHGLVISVTNERIKTLCSARHRMTLEFSKARPGNEKFNNNSSLRLFV